MCVSYVVSAFSLIDSDTLISITYLCNGRIKRDTNLEITIT